MNEDSNWDELSPDEWLRAIEDRLFDKGRRPLEIAQKALRQFPDDSLVLQLAAFAALVEDQPDLALRYLKKLNKFFYPSPAALVCKAIALAQLSKWPLAQALLENLRVTERFLSSYLPQGLDRRWTQKWVHAIVRWQPKVEGPHMVAAMNHDSVPKKSFDMVLAHLWPGSKKKSIYAV
jgi:hypothetical protein